ncbi:MAG: hypothetical protein EOP04_21025, partial [Proteobacteria bacterium]
MEFNSERFRNLCFLVLAFLPLACSVGDDHGKHIIGSPINQINPRAFQLFEEGSEQRFYSFDNYGKRMIFIDPVRKNVEFSADLGERGLGQAWLAANENLYSFHIKGGSVFVVKSGAIEPVEVIKVAGSIRSYAADEKEGYYAFVDEFFSMALLKVGADGNVLSQWTGGSIINGVSNVVAGEMLAGGKLALLTDQQSILIVDINQTLVNQAWVYEEIPGGFKSPSWLGKVDGRNDRVLVLDEDSLDLIDLANRVVVASESIKNVSVSKGGRDHVYTYDFTADKYSFYFAGPMDTIAKSEIKLTGNSPEQTYLSAESLVLKTDRKNIIKIRLSDGLV